MRKEIPWTLEEKKMKSKRSIKNKSKIAKRNSLYKTIEELFKQNSNKEFSLRELCEKVEAERSNVSAAVRTLHKDKKIKIVGFREDATHSAVPLYQYKSGKCQEIEVLNCNSTKFKKMKLMSVYNFIKTSKDLNYNLVSVADLKKRLRKSRCQGIYVKTDTIYACYYKKEDLEGVVETKKNSKRKLINNSSKPTNSSVKKEKALKFKILGFTITISR